MLFFNFRFAETLSRPEVLRMSELNDSSELQTYSSAVLYVLSAVTPPPEYVEVIAENFISAIKSSTVRSKSRLQTFFNMDFSLGAFELTRCLR